MLAREPLPAHRAPATEDSAIDDAATQAAVQALARRERRPFLVFVGAMAVSAIVLVGGLVLAPEAGWWAGGGVALMVATTGAGAAAAIVGVEARKRRRWTRILARSRWQLVEAVVLPKLVPVRLSLSSGRAMVVVLDPDQGSPAAVWDADRNSRVLRTFRGGVRRWSYLAVDSSGTHAVLTDVDRTGFLPMTCGTPSSQRWAWRAAESLWEFAPPSQRLPPSPGASPSG